MLPVSYFSHSTLSIAVIAFIVTHDIATDGILQLWIKRHRLSLLAGKAFQFAKVMANSGMVASRKINSAFQRIYPEKAYTYAWMVI